MKKIKVWLADDWIRTLYYNAVTEICEELFSATSDRLLVLEYAQVGGIIPIIISEFAPMSLRLAPYPEYDIQEEGQFQPGMFDVVIADQVLEHVPYVMKAVKQCVNICKSGGYLFFGTPWQYPYHPAPKDFWRISRDAYQMMFDEFGVETIEIDGWGHKEALIFGHQTDGFLRAVDDEGELVRTVAQAEEAGLFEVENDPDHAIEIWAVGRKK